jgi:hypothetical protein
VIIDQAIPEKLSIASYSTREMYTAAQRFMTEFSTHFQQAVEGLQVANVNFDIICLAGNAKIAASTLLECMQRVHFETQGLNMAVERYACRWKPDYAGLPVLALQLDVRENFFEWAEKLYGQGLEWQVASIITGELHRGWSSCQCVQLTATVC